MSTTVSDYIKQIDEVISKVDDVVAQSVIKNDDAIIYMNTQLQLYNEGIDSKGNDLIPYKPYTVFEKQLSNQPFDRTTLKDTGSFYRGFRVQVISNTLFITSTDEKTSELMGKYGNDIFGLTKENQVTLFDEIIKPDLWAFLKEKL